MSNLKEKSKLNIDAAKLLFDELIFAPSIHCSYYSVLQLMKHAICHTIGLSYQDQERELNSYRQLPASPRGTHEYIIEKIEDVIMRVDRSNFVEFDRKVKDLKKFRIKSDYDNIDITFEQSRKAMGYANDLRDQLKRTFNV